jgi:hypothetical protein
MDVSVKRSAAEFCANVIARSVDRATTKWNADKEDKKDKKDKEDKEDKEDKKDKKLRCFRWAFMSSLSFLSTFFVNVVAAGDYVRLRSLRFAPTHIHRPYSVRRPHPLSST